jgi:hypothetical protein
MKKLQILSLFLNLVLSIALIFALIVNPGNSEKKVVSNPLNPTSKNYKPIPHIEDYAGLPTGLVDNMYPTETCGQKVDEKELQLTGYRINFNYCPTIDLLNYEMITPYEILMAASGDQPEGKRISYWAQGRLTTFVTMIDHWDFLSPDPGLDYMDDGTDISLFYVQVQSNGQFGCLGPDPDLVKSQTNGVFTIHRGQLQVTRWSDKCASHLARAKELGIKIHP